MFQLGGQLQQGGVVGVAADQLHAERQAVGRPVQRQADGGLAGGVEGAGKGAERSHGGAEAFQRVGRVGQHAQAHRRRGDGGRDQHVDLFKEAADAAHFLVDERELAGVVHAADATANANLSARLPYLFACCRFAHYLKCIVRDKIGSFKERDDVQLWLNNWIMNYVDGDPGNSSESVKAMKPLAAAEVVVEEIEENPGYYSAKFFLRPHYQLEGLTVSLRLVSKLPSVKQTVAQ